MTCDDGSEHEMISHDHVWEACRVCRFCGVTERFPCPFPHTSADLKISVIQDSGTTCPEDPKMTRI